MKKLQFFRILLLLPFFVFLLPSSQAQPSLFGRIGESEVIDTSGPRPHDEALREAIVKGVKFLLSTQKEDGSWNEKLSIRGSLGATADEAVDAVSFTTLCALGLREHAALLPDKDVRGAVRKATQYVMDRVIRGTLSNSVMYAIWRYSLGLQLIVAEYKDIAKSREPEAIEYRRELGLVAGRMIKNISAMQFGVDNLIKPKTRIYGAHSAPTNFGLICAYPTEEDYRGGALVVSVIPGSSAEEKGLKAGDRVCKLNGMNVENSYDYYDIASDFVGGQKISLSYYQKREGGNGHDVEKKDKRIKTVSVSLKNSWPGYLGFKIEENNNLEVSKVISSALKDEKKPKLVKGDKIIKVDGEDVSSLEDFKKVLLTLELGKKINIKIKRGEKTKNVKVVVLPVPVGQVLITPVYEDNSGRNGVKVDSVNKKMGSNIKSGDRIVQFNNSPVLGLDHFISLLTTCPQDVPVSLIVIRRGKKLKTVVTPIEITFSRISDAHNIGEVKATGSSLDVVWKVQVNEDFYVMPVYVEEVIKKGVSDNILKKGDRIESIEYNGKVYKTKYKEKLLEALKNIPAGSEVVIELIRKNKSETVTIKRTAKEATSGDARVKGGWSYYKVGEAFSFVSATVILAMLDVQKHMTKDLPRVYSKKVISKILEPSFSFMNKMKKFGAYAYRPGSAPGMDFKARGAMGRITACELAMVNGKQRKHNKKSLTEALELWLKQREELDLVRLYRGTHNTDHYSNAAYYWLFSHYHSARAANEVSKKLKERVHDTILKVMLATQRKNGTWLGHYAFGEICGTARALMIFGEINGDFRHPTETSQ